MTRLSQFGKCTTSPERSPLLSSWHIRPHLPGEEHRWRTSPYAGTGVPAAPSCKPPSRQHPRRGPPLPPAPAPVPRPCRHPHRRRRRRITAIRRRSTSIPSRPARSQPTSRDQWNSTTGAGRQTGRAGPPRPPVPSRARPGRHRSTEDSPLTRVAAHQFVVSRPVPQPAGGRCGSHASPTPRAAVILARAHRSLDAAVDRALPPERHSPARAGPGSTICRARA